jgi:mono/diheme cytochrome c family protein
MRGTTLFRVMLCLLVAGALAASLAALPRPADESEELYNQKCANCHAKDGSGHTNASSKLAVPDLRSDAIRKMSDAELADSVANGTKHRDYPHAFLHIGVTSEQIAGLVKYIRVLQSEKKPPEKK